MSAEIYLIKLSDAADFTDGYCAEFFPERYKRAGRMRLPEDRLRCIGAGVLLHEILGLNDSDISITGQGKPYSDKISRKFSIAHSGDYSALAVADTGIGVDIERIDARRLPVAKRVLTPEELEWTGEDPEKRFFALWTLKESVSKALGCGLSLGFGEFSVLSLLNGEKITVRGREFYGRNIPMDGYGLSICTENADAGVPSVCIFEKKHEMY